MRTLVGQQPAKALGQEAARSAARLPALKVPTCCDFSLPDGKLVNIVLASN
jgi:hypothetical protein